MEFERIKLELEQFRPSLDYDQQYRSLIIITMKVDLMIERQKAKIFEIKTESSVGGANLLAGEINGLRLFMME